MSEIPEFNQRHRHDLSLVTRTKGGHKIRPEAMYAVYTDGRPAGICGDVWLANAYRYHTWDDTGHTTRSRDAEFDLPFAPERIPEPEVILSPAEQTRTRYRYKVHQFVDLDFSQALVALRGGYSVRRKNWAGHYLMDWSVLASGQILYASGEPLLQVVAQFNQPTLLATDWEVINPD